VLVRLVISCEDCRIVEESLKATASVQHGRYSLFLNPQDLGERDSALFCPLILEINIAMVMPASR
jgi:hypothetical protein